MQLETVKSFTLWVLIGISILLTFALWSYQPDSDSLPEDQAEESVNLGGTEETTGSLIEPYSIIFKNQDRYYGFSDKADRQSLYENMQSWVLYEFETAPSNGRPSEQNQMEVIFPDTLPMKVAGSLFTFNNDENLPDWDFDRLFITFNRDSTSLNIIFLSEDGDQEASAVVNNTETFENLWEYLTTFEGLSDYIRVDSADKPIYIPKNKVDVASKSVAVQEINAGLMVDELFRNPDIVSRNQVSGSEVYFTDGARGTMRVFQDRRTMEFRNPLESPYEQMDPVELIELSKSNINQHKGWTDDYNLRTINTSSNTISFQMFYDDYPVFGDLNSSVIEQQYRNMELNQYKRPLFRVTNYLGQDGSAEVLSGTDVVYNLRNHSSYDMENITDIRIGYDLFYQENADAVTLNPAWFMKYSGSWEKIQFEDISQQRSVS